MSAIVSNKNILSGKPRIQNTRMSVNIISSYLASGYGIKDIKRDYPHLTDEQIKAAINYLDQRIHKERGKLELRTA